MMEFSMDGKKYDFKTKDDGHADKSIKLAIEYFKLCKGQILYIKDGNHVVPLRL